MKLLNKEDVCERLAVSPRCLDNWVKIKKFPPGQRFGKRDYWTETAVERWVQLLFVAQENWEPN